MKRKITITLLSLLLVAGVHTLSAREQWTVEQAWQWQERVGVIKGFNEPYPVYPGMSRADVLKKAHDVGLNSVRFWVRGETAEEHCHPDMLECFFIVSGDLQVKINGAVYQCTENDFIMIDCNEKHELKALTDCRFMTIGCAI